MRDKRKSVQLTSSSADAASAARYIRNELNALKALAREQKQTMLYYLLDMAYMETDRIIHPNADIIEEHQDLRNGTDTD